MSLVNENLILKFGAHKGCNIEKVASEKPQYCQWLLKQPFLDEHKDIKTYLEDKFINKDEIYLSFGKYKNKPLSWVKANDVGYIENYLKKNDFVKEKMKKLYEAL